MIKSKAVGLAVAAAGAAALSVALASPASARTAYGCTVTPKTPIFAGHNSSGVKLVNYRISVNCQPDRTVHIEQRRFETDPWPNPDDHLGNSSFDSSGVTTISNVRTLVNTEIGNEEVIQKVQFRVSSNGVTSPWTPWESSPELSISN